MNSRNLAGWAVKILIVVATCKSACPAEYYPPPDSSGGWRTLTNPSEIRRITGVDVRKLDDTFSYIQGTSPNGGLLVVRHGWLVYERYYGRGDRKAAPDTMSCGKVFTSIAMGILMHERGDLFPDGLDQKVYTERFLPTEAFPINDPRKSEIKLGQLLAMSAGLAGNSPGFIRGRAVPFAPAGFDGWRAMVDANAFSERLWCDPGAGYAYATVGPHIISAIVRHITGMELQQYLEGRVATPLGWDRWGFAFRNHPEVRHTPGGGGIALRATDMLRFGYLLLHHGNWNGQQIVPADYVAKATVPSPYNPHYAYSLQIELNSDGAAPAAPRDAYWKGGYGGFAICIVPSLDLVISKMGGYAFQYGQSDTGLPEVKPPIEGRVWKRSVEEDPGTLHMMEMVTAAVAKDKN